MAVKILSESDDEFVIEVTIRKSARFLEREEQIRDALIQAGMAAAERCRESGAEDGAPDAAADAP